MASKDDDRLIEILRSVRVVADGVKCCGVVEKDGEAEESRMRAEWKLKVILKVSLKKSIHLLRSLVWINSLWIIFCGKKCYQTTASMSFTLSEEWLGKTMWIRVLLITIHDMQINRLWLAKSDANLMLPLSKKTTQYTLLVVLQRHNQTISSSAFLSWVKDATLMCYMYSNARLNVFHHIGELLMVSYY